MMVIRRAGQFAVILLLFAAVAALADWPAYRLEWQTLGSLQRRLRACYYGVRAELPPFGSPDLVALELYLAKRAEGLPTSPPGVRR